MSRISCIARRPRRTLGALATLMVAAGLTLGSGAYFTSQASSGNNTVNPGHVGLTEYSSAAPDINAADPTSTRWNLHVDSTKVSDITFDVNNAYPGMPTYLRAFAFQNTGTVPEYLKLSVVPTSGSSNDLAQGTQLAITRVPLIGAPGSLPALSPAFIPVVAQPLTLSTPQISIIGGGPITGLPPYLWFFYLYLLRHEGLVAPVLPWTPVEDSSNAADISDVVGDIDSAFNTTRIPLQPGQTWQYVVRVRVPDSGQQNNLEDKGLGFTVVGTANTSPTA